MMKAILTILSVCCLTLSLFAQLENYKIFTAKGKEVSYDKMLKSLQKQEVILFGELHNNVIAHWLELEVLKSLSGTQKVAVGLEMFERDNEADLQNYLNDSINKKAFDTLVRFWPNYATDYAPLLEFCKKDSIPFHATNIPRTFANLVYKKDFQALDSLSEKEKSWIAPLPITYYDTLPQYQAILEMMGDHGTPTLVKAQAIKDATMAYFALELLLSAEQVIHYHGTFHSNYHEGIYWYIKHYRPQTSIQTIATVDQEDLKKLTKEHYNKADYIIVVDSDFPTSY
ncbi:ChaN family lipoprotein [Lishizhenia tianjinensis]|nr:ChaN family lipoprotein [Lishizhenia tianjinensis]